MTNSLRQLAMCGAFVAVAMTVRAAIAGGSAVAVASWEFRPFSANPDAPQLLNLRSLNEERAG